MSETAESARVKLAKQIRLMTWEELHSVACDLYDLMIKQTAKNEHEAAECLNGWAWGTLQEEPQEPSNG